MSTIVSWKNLSYTSSNLNPSSRKDKGSVLWKASGQAKEGDLLLVFDHRSTHSLVAGLNEKFRESSLLFDCLTTNIESQDHLLQNFDRTDSSSVSWKGLKGQGIDYVNLSQVIDCYYDDLTVEETLAAQTGITGSWQVTGKGAKDHVAAVLKEIQLGWCFLFFFVLFCFVLTIMLWLVFLLLVLFVLFVLFVYDVDLDKNLNTIFARFFLCQQ